MDIEIEITDKPIAEKISAPLSGAKGAWLEFRGVVRSEENGAKISALEYEAYPEMAAREIQRLMEQISSRHPCLAAKIIHRIGIIPVGETAIYVGVASSHRAEAIALLAEFMDKLKRDVPIWKRRALTVVEVSPSAKKTPSGKTPDDAFAEISSYCKSLPAVRLPLAESFGYILRETVKAPTDMPDSDRSTRDGYAVLVNDSSGSFQVVDTIHAADWKPRQIKSGEAVRVATGATLPCEHLRVLMQEHIERTGDKIRVIKSDSDLNIRKRGEEVKAGVPLVQSGARLNAGELALLASAGCVEPLVSPHLRIVHFTSGDEVVPPGETPKPGQIRDSNSILIQGLLKKFPCELFQRHLREDFEAAKGQIESFKSKTENADVIMISGGASVGDKDFTRPLLESLGFKIIFSQVGIRPGKPTIFGVNGHRIAFGLPGNPLAHFVCFHLFVAVALAKLSGGEPNRFLCGRLAIRLDDAECPRETLWPSRLEIVHGQARLHPLAWSSSGDVRCLTEANALIRVPPNCSALGVGAEIDFLPTGTDY